MELKGLANKYNAILKRVYKALDWFESVSKEDIDKWLPKFNQLLGELDAIGKQIEKESGIKLTDEQILNGFEGVE
jgi:hypothetical protein